MNLLSNLLKPTLTTISACMLAVAFQPGSGKAQAPPDSGITQAQQYYEEARFGDAVRLLTSPANVSLLSKEDQRTARELLARSYVRVGNTDAAVATFFALLVDDPSWRPNRVKLPPDELEAFDRALRRMEAEGPLVAPSDLTIKKVTTSYVELSWRDNATNESGYEVDRKDGERPFIPIKTIASNQTAYLDDSVIPGTGYRYRVRAVSSADSSAFSGETWVTTPDSFRRSFVWGGFVGVSRSHLSGAGVDEAQDAAESLGATFENKSVYGGTAGISLEYALTPSISLQTELAWTSDGGGTESSNGTSNYQETLRFYNLEIPLLAKAYPLSGSSIALYGGPSFAFQVGSSGEIESSGGTTEGKVQEAESTNFGAIAGAQLPLFAIGRSRTFADVRYRVGISERLKEGSPEVSGQSLALLFGVSLSSGR